MNSDDVERMLGRVEPASPPERLERQVLAEGERLLRREPERAFPRNRRWGIAGVAAACVLLSVIVWRILDPREGDPGWAPCRVAVELETHLDTSMAGGPPAIPTGGPSLESYVPLFRKADAVKPLAAELRWQQIPWITDPEEAQRMARAERRPLFVWVSSDDPLARCCGCAAGLRAGPLSHEDVVGRISAGFVPVAVNKNALAEGNAKEFLNNLRRQKSQYHGIWIVSPDGKVLAAIEKWKTTDKDGWPREILETMDSGLAAFGPVTPRATVPGNLLRDRGAGLRPDGGVSLAVVARLMHKGARDGPVVFDQLTLSAQEWAQLLPPPGPVGTERAVPDALARKFTGILSPVSDAEFTPRPDHAKTAELRSTVASLEGGVATIALSGRWETEHRTREGKQVRASATGEGLVVFDLEKTSVRSLLLVTTGVWGIAPEVRESGAVVEWTSAP